MLICKLLDASYVTTIFLRHKWEHINKLGTKLICRWLLALLKKKLALRVVTQLSLGIWFLLDHRLKPKYELILSYGKALMASYIPLIHVLCHSLNSCINLISCIPLKILVDTTRKLREIILSLWKTTNFICCGTSLLLLMFFSLQHAIKTRR